MVSRPGNSRIQGNPQITGKPECPRTKIRVSGYPPEQNPIKGIPGPGIRKAGNSLILPLLKNTTKGRGCGKPKISLFLKTPSKLISPTTRKQPVLKNTTKDTAALQPVI